MCKVRQGGRDFAVGGPVVLAHGFAKKWLSRWTLTVPHTHPCCRFAATMVALGGGLQDALSAEKAMSALESQVVG